ncbi:hypothetical protein SprV_0501883400 [Sparganum proliferum]
MSSKTVTEILYREVVRLSVECLLGLTYMASTSVIVLTDHSASPTTGGASQSVLEFLYQLYNSFSLDTNPFETIISPQDEEAILQLVLSDGHSSGKVCLLHGLNLSSLLHEFTSNATLKEAVFGATYVVTSHLLSWFEWLVLSLLIEAGVPSLKFECFSSSQELPFFHLQQCHLVRESFIQTDQIQRTLLAYLSVAVNVKNTLDLALVVNRPFRGFGRSFFSTLRRVSKKTGILPGQVVISFPGCMTESAATSTVKEDGRLVPYAAALNHLADTIRACQDALSGFLAEDESGASCAMAASCSATSSMSSSAALQAIEACLTVAAKTFSKPPPQLPSVRTGALAASSAPRWPLAAVKKAKSALIERLRLLFERQSDQQELVATPNRPASSGGSVQGRAAFKWARLFLVSEAASRLGNPSSSPSLSSPKTPRLVRHASTEAAAAAFLRTPSSATATRSTLTNFFLSPSTPERTPGVAPTRGDQRRNPQSPLSALSTSASPQHNSSVLQPRRPVNARFQSNLDWATATNSPSPVSSCRTSWSAVLFGEESQSSILPPSSVVSPPDINTPTSPKLSSHAILKAADSTSVVKPTSPEKRPRYLFPDVEGSENRGILNPTKRQPPLSSRLPKNTTTSNSDAIRLNPTFGDCGHEVVRKAVIDWFYGSRDQYGDRAKRREAIGGASDDTRCPTLPPSEDTELQKLGLQQPSAPLPEKLTRGADFSRWEARMKEHLRGVDASSRSQTIMGLLYDEVYDLARSADISTSMPASDILDRLRPILVASVHPWILQSEFRGRFQQPGEGGLDYQQSLRLLGPRAFPTMDAAALTQRVLEQYIAGVRHPEIRKLLMRGQPATLDKALDLARQEEALQAVCDRPTQPLFGIAAVRPQTVRDCATQMPWRPCSCGSYYPRQNQWRRQPPRRVPGPQTRRPVQAVDVSTEERGVFPDISNDAGKFILDTDASDTAIGAVLSQQQSDGTERVIQYLSRSLTKAERRYCVTRKEMLALTHFVEECRPYLQYRPFIELQKLGLQQPSAPLPEKLTRGADFSRWEARMKEHLRGVDASSRSQTIMGLLYDEVYDLARSADISTSMPASDILDRLRPILMASVHLWILQSEFRGRFQQPGEGVLDYQQSLRLLGRRAFPTMDAAALTQRVLEQYIACVRHPEIRKLLMRGQPATLDKALDLARQEEALQAVCDRPTQPLFGIAAVRPQTVRDCATQMPWRPCSCGSYYPRQNQWRRQPPRRVPGPQTRRPVQAVDVSTEERGASGYWQVEVRPSDREKTAFAVPSGLYEFETMTFGLANAPSTFQRLMNQALEQLIPTSCLIYMDDIIVLGKDFHSYLKNIRAVFNSLRQAGLTLKPSKCIFIKPRVKFLGHVVSAAGIETEDEKVTQIREWPTPADVTEVRSFLRLASYYRRFIKDYVRIAGPPHKLTQKNVKFKWTADGTNSSQTLKDKLCSTPILVFPDISNDAGKFILDTDASDTAIGAVLSQQQSDGTERVIQKVSNARPLSKAELAGHSYETRCLHSLWDKLFIENGVLFYHDIERYPKRVVLPLPMVDDVVERMHAEIGHSGIHKTEWALRRRYYWPNQKTDIQNVVRSCGHCLGFKSPGHSYRAPLQPITTGYPNERVAIDLVGPIAPSARANMFVLVMVDCFTKMAEAVPLPDASAPTVGRAIFNGWICRRGAPDQLHSDRGSSFESSVVHESCKVLKIKKTRTTAYNPHGNGQVERKNRTLINLLRAFVNRNSALTWDEALPACMLAYRSTVNATTQHTPFFLMCGREMQLPEDLHLPPIHPVENVDTYASRMKKALCIASEEARLHLQEGQRRQKAFYDRLAHGTPYKEGDIVWMRNFAPSPGIPQKFNPAWIGPYVVRKVLSDTTCVVRSQYRPYSEESTVHFNRLNPGPSTEADTDRADSGASPSHAYNDQIVEQYLEVPREGGYASAEVVRDGHLVERTVEVPPDDGPAIALDDSAEDSRPSSQGGAM